MFAAGTITDTIDARELSAEELFIEELSIEGLFTDESKEELIEESIGITVDELISLPIAETSNEVEESFTEVPELSDAFKESLTPELLSLKLA